MPPPNLAQDRLARAQHPNQQSSYTTSSPARGSGGPRPSTASSLGLRGNASPLANTRGDRTSGTAGSNGRSADPQGERLKGDEARGARNNEMWEDRQRRHKAATVLGSWELLAWYAVAGNEKSIPQTRLRFQRMLIGMGDKESSDEWEDEKNGGDGEPGKGAGAVAKRKH